MVETITARRHAEVSRAVADIRAIEAASPLDRARIQAMRDRLVELTRHRELFPAADFPPPEGGERLGSRLYRLSQDDDDRFALYVNACRDTTDTPPHNHTTWAVVVGFDGEELNRFYRRTPTGVEETHSEVVKNGTGVAMLPDDLHSIHIRGGALNFHMYGLALERLDRREYFRAEEGAWHVFPPHQDIREARPGVSASPR